MSLLRFIRRDRTERPAPAATIEVVPPPPVPAPSAFAVPPPATPAAVDLERIRRELQEIQRIVGAEDTIYGQVRAPQDAVEVNIKLSELVRLCPQAFKDAESLQQASQTVIQVAVPGLYDQLTKGRVSTQLHLLTADIPVDYLAPYAAEHAEDQVLLPLNMVVGSLQPEDLRRRTASQERDLGDKLLPNLFTPASVAAAAAEASVAPPAPVEEPVVAAAPAPAPAPASPEVAAETSTDEPASVVSEPAAEVALPPTPEPVADVESVPVYDLTAEPPPAEEPVAAVESVPVYDLSAEAQPDEEPAVEPVAEPAVAQGAEPPPVAELPAPAEAPVQPDAEPPPVEAMPAAERDDEASATRLLLSGLDLNSATAEEMHARLDGVGLKLAQRIVACREADGPFADLFDLARVPGLRARRFEQVTGLPWNAAYFRHREQVKQILGVADGAMPDVRQVAARFTEITDFSGCMVIDEDGLVLAQSWNHPSADALGAFAPQMFKKIHRYVKPLKLGEMNSLCFFVGHQPITVVRSGSIYFAALHQPDKLTKKQVTLAQALAMELGRRFARS